LLIFFHVANFVVGQKLSYGDREPWKTIKERTGTTHPARREKAIQESRSRNKNDGRPPDTTKELVKSTSIQSTRIKSTVSLTKPFKPPKPWQYMRPQLHQDGIRLLSAPNNGFQSYPWNEKASCWFDTSLEALFFYAAHVGLANTRTLMSGHKKLQLLLDHITARFDVYESVESTWAVEKQLAALRDDIASQLGLDLLQYDNPLVRSMIQWLINIRYGYPE